jgi:hypothetical protein
MFLLLFLCDLTLTRIPTSVYPWIQRAEHVTCLYRLLVRFYKILKNDTQETSGVSAGDHIEVSSVVGYSCDHSFTPRKDG